MIYYINMYTRNFFSVHIFNSTRFRNKKSKYFALNNFWMHMNDIHVDPICCQTSPVAKKNTDNSVMKLTLVTILQIVREEICCGNHPATKLPLTKLPLLNLSSKTCSESKFRLKSKHKHIKPCLFFFFKKS